MALGLGFQLLCAACEGALVLVQEAMRMRPAVPSGYARVVARDVRLSNGLVLPRGATLTGSNLATLNSPAFWDQPERFMPVGLACLSSPVAWEVFFFFFFSLGPVERFGPIHVPGLFCFGVAWAPASQATTAPAPDHIEAGFFQPVACRV